jgi:hypothetical protein
VGVAEIFVADDGFGAAAGFHEVKEQREGIRWVEGNRLHMCLHANFLLPSSASR